MHTNRRLQSLAFGAGLSLFLVACTHKEAAGSAPVASTTSGQPTQAPPESAAQGSGSWQTATANTAAAASGIGAAPAATAVHAVTGTSAVSAHTIPTSASATTAPALITTTAAETPMHYASTKVNGNHFSLAVAMRTECAVGAECTGSITLTASGGYHINNEYPYKFVVDSQAGATWLASDGKGFGRATGEFQKTTEYVAVLGVRYRGTQAGPVRLSGTYKMSVCSEANCQVESVPLSVNVTFQ